jgi:hypothetical protein
MTLDELVADVCPTIGSLGAKFYFLPETVAKGKELGLDGFRFYFLGRGGVLGDVEAPVIQSAFGYFEPQLVRKLWDSGRERISGSPRDIGRLYVEISRDFGRRHFAEVADLDGFCAAAEQVVAAANPAGLALFAGLAAEPLPEDGPGRAMQLVTVLRELRGSVHLLAVVAVGVSPRVAHYFRRPNDMAAFGYGEADIPTLTDEDRASMAEADALTDRIMAGFFAVLDEPGRQALAAGAHALEAAAP